MDAYVFRCESCPSLWIQRGPPQRTCQICGQTVDGEPVQLEDYEDDEDSAGGEEG